MRVPVSIDFSKVYAEKILYSETIQYKILKEMLSEEWKDYKNLMLKEGVRVSYDATTDSFLATPLKIKTKTESRYSGGKLIKEEDIAERAKVIGSETYGGERFGICQDANGYYAKCMNCSDGVVINPKEYFNNINDAIDYAKDCIKQFLYADETSLQEDDNTYGNSKTGSNDFDVELGSGGGVGMSDTYPGAAHPFMESEEDDDSDFGDPNLFNDFYRNDKKNDKSDFTDTLLNLHRHEDELEGDNWKDLGNLGKKGPNDSIEEAESDEIDNLLDDEKFTPLFNIIKITDVDKAAHEYAIKNLSNEDNIIIFGAFKAGATGEKDYDFDTTAEARAYADGERWAKENNNNSINEDNDMDFDEGGYNGVGGLPNKESHAINEIIDGENTLAPEDEDNWRWNHEFEMMMLSSDDEEDFPGQASPNGFEDENEIIEEDQESDIHQHLKLTENKKSNREYYEKMRKLNYIPRIDGEKDANYYAEVDYEPHYNRAKEKAANKTKKEPVYESKKKKLNETGEWEPGGHEELAWIEDFKSKLETIQSYLGNSFKIGQIKGFDKYQGPYCICSYEGKNLKFWSLEDGDLWIDNYKIDNTSGDGQLPGYKGAPEQIADVLGGNKVAEPARYKNIAESKKMKKLNEDKQILNDEDENEVEDTDFDSDMDSLLNFDEEPAEDEEIVSVDGQEPVISHETDTTSHQVDVSQLEQLINQILDGRKEKEVYQKIPTGQLNTNLNDFGAAATQPVGQADEVDDDRLFASEFPQVQDRISVVKDKINSELSYQDYLEGKGKHDNDEVTAEMVPIDMDAPEEVDVVSMRSDNFDDAGSFEDDDNDFERNADLSNGEDEDTEILLDDDDDEIEEAPSIYNETVSKETKNLIVEAAKRRDIKVKEIKTNKNTLDILVERNNKIYKIHYEDVSKLRNKMPFSIKREKFQSLDEALKRIDILNSKKVTEKSNFKKFVTETIIKREGGKTFKDSAVFEGLENVKDIKGWNVRALGNVSLKTGINEVLSNITTNTRDKNTLVKTNEGQFFLIKGSLNEKSKVGMQKQLVDIEKKREYGIAKVIGTYANSLKGLGQIMEQIQRTNIPLLIWK